MPEERDYDFETAAKNQRKSKKRIAENQRRSNRTAFGQVGKRKDSETPLYVKCLHCEGDLERRDDCLCHNGYVETGFTQERYDRLITKNDKLLLALDEALRNLNPSERLTVLRANGYTEDDVETARSRK